MLSTHAVAGALVAELFPMHPVVGFAAGFASHFALDSLPHWDYKLKSVRKDDNPLETDMILGKEFLIDISRIAFDIAVGFVIAIALASVLHLSIFLACIGAAAGVLPDGLQFMYFKTRSTLLKPLQIFHIWIQKGRSLHISAWKGISLQLALVIILVVVVQHVL